MGIDRRETAEPATARAGTPAGGHGQQLFVQTCGGCHALDAAGSQGTVGPDLDALKPAQARVQAAIEEGGRGTGSMPPKLLSGSDEQAVARYVSSVAGAS